MAIDMGALLGDLAAEAEAVAAMLELIEDSAWDLPTPALGWTIRDQVSHIAYFDEAAIMALRDPDQFKRESNALLIYGPAFPDELTKRYRATPPSELLQWLKSARAELVSAFTGVDARHRMPWYGPEMSAASSLTARLMETWAHGVDIADALGAPVLATNRLRHIAHLGYITRGFSYVLRSREAPEETVRVELLAPDGSTWCFGPKDSDALITGDALDFCLVVTQRRNLADTNITASSAASKEWMRIAQAFAGTPGRGRSAKSSKEIRGGS